MLHDVGSATKIFFCKFLFRLTRCTNLAFFGFYYVPRYFLYAKTLKKFISLDKINNSKGLSTAFIIRSFQG